MSVVGFLEVDTGHTTWRKLFENKTEKELLKEVYNYIDQAKIKLDHINYIKIYEVKNEYERVS